MKFVSRLSAALVCSIIISCKEKVEKAHIDPATDPQAKVYTHIAKAHWLLGSWGHTTAEGALSEKWVQLNDSVLHGESYFVVGGKDTVFAETVILEETGGKLVYTVTVPGENEEKPVPFTMTLATEKQLVFENPQHDYPNKIVYNKISNDSLTAEISGMQKGKPAFEQFAMKRQ